ncbi:hypothetical protein BDW69DRAFT_167065 [Aspergillus filifer]
MHAVQGWDLLHLIFLARHAEQDVMGRGLEGFSCGGEGSFSWVASNEEVEVGGSEAAIGIGMGTVAVIVWWVGIEAMFLDLLY